MENYSMMMATKNWMKVMMRMKMARRNWKMVTTN
jgi:hypothetical protein